MRASRSDSGERFSARDIHGVRYGFKMIWIDAGPHAALVVNLFTLGNRPAAELVGEAMREYLIVGSR